MRLIDADALKKDWGMANRCEDCPRDARDCQYGMVLTRMDVCGMLDDAPTVGGWISVKERMPEPPAQCLVYSDKARRPRGMETATYTEFGWMTAAYFPEITHWMPLPEPPEEVQE